MNAMILTQVETYLEEILEALDFSALNEFLNQHMRTEMNFSELVSQVSVNGLDAVNKENIMISKTRRRLYFCSCNASKPMPQPPTASMANMASATAVVAAR